MSVNRIHKSKDFSQIANVALRDERLSYRARGILAMVLSHADGWVANSKWITASGKEGRDSVRNALLELEALGYRRVSRHQDKMGHWVTEIHWSEVPMPDPPKPENPYLGETGSIQNTITEHY